MVRSRQLSTKLHQRSALGLIRAVTAAVYGVADQETAIRWLIALMVLSCGPLAIALTATVSHGAENEQVSRIAFG
jgi:hypothetical protein